VSVELDHFIVPSHDRVASARRLAHLLGVAYEDTTWGIFSPVYLNDGLTLDFVETEESYPVHHYCFRVSSEKFDTILARIRAEHIEYRSRVHGPVDMQVSTEFGGKDVYWNDPDGHQWEMLTVSYARRPP
jgi:catechol 2,3-dioxygenase-like lactoylglutathione lyase family enzyme